jgi:hypothetical protein
VIELTLRRAALTVLIALLVGGLTPAQALPEPGDALLVEVTAIEPQFPQPGDTLTVRGTVTNRSGQEALNVQGLLRISPEPLISRSDVALVTDLATSRRGIAQEQTLTPVAETLAPATSAEFEISAPVDELPLTGNGVYAVFAEVRVPGTGSFDTAFPLTWFPQPDAIDPSRIVVLAPIRSAVDLTANNVLRSPGFAASMAPGGALHTVATGAAAAAEAGVAVSWLIDPAVTGSAAILASGTGTFPEAATNPSAAADVVGAFLDTLTGATATANAATYVTPYAEVDASGVLTAQQPNLLAQSIDRAAAAPATAQAAAGDDPLAPARGIIPVGPNGSSTTASLLAYEEATVSGIVLGASAVPTVEELSYSPSGVAAIPLPGGASVTGIIPDDLLRQDLLRPASTPAEQFRMRQGLLADAAMISLELPQSARTVVLPLDQSLAMAPEVLATSLTGLQQAGFIDVVGLPALLAPDVPRVERLLTLDEQDEGRLPGSYLAPIPPLEARLEAFARVTVDPLAFEEDYRTAILRSASANWRPDQQKGAALLDSIDAELTAEEQKVTTVSTGTVTLSGSSGNLPLTISNELDQAVEVGVQLAAEPSVRLAFMPPDLVRVDAGRRVSVEIPVEIFGSGPLPVTVILTDRDGHPFIETGDLVIRSAATTIAAGAVAVVAAIVFVVLVIWRFRKRGEADS